MDLEVKYRLEKFMDKQYKKDRKKADREGLICTKCFDDINDESESDVCYYIRGVGNARRKGICMECHKTKKCRVAFILKGVV
jgi:hypothetical protein